MPKKKKTIKRKPAKKRAPKAAKKKVARKPAKKAVQKAVPKRIKKKSPKKASLKKPALEPGSVGKITHYFPHVRAAVIKLTKPLSVGDTIKIKGHTTDFTQTISSMQVDHVPIQNGKKGDEIGLLVDSRVRQHDQVIKV